MKRMIDNKEFNALVKGFNDLTLKVDNLKDVPTIEIEASQMSGTTCELTDEQFEILNNYPVVYVVLADGRTLTFYKETIALQSENIINFVSFANDVNQEDKIDTFAFIIIIDKTDKTALFMNNKVGGESKQLYQHNISFVEDTSGYAGIMFPIINDSPTPFTKSTLANWLYDKGYSNKIWGCSGKVNDGSTKALYGVNGYQSGDIYASILGGTSCAVRSITDDVIEL